MTNSDPYLHQAMGSVRLMKDWHQNIPRCFHRIQGLLLLLTLFTAPFFISFSLSHSFTAVLWCTTRGFPWYSRLWLDSNSHLTALIWVTSGINNKFPSTRLECILDVMFHRDHTVAWASLQMLYQPWYVHCVMYCFPLHFALLPPTSDITAGPQRLHVVVMPVKKASSALKMQGLL